MDWLLNAIYIPNIQYFYIVCFFIFFVYFVVSFVTHLYVYKFRKDKLFKYKIQKEEPALENILWDIAWSIVTMSVFVLMSYVLIVLINNGYTKVYFDIHQYGLLYFIFTIALFTILHDTYYYWAHKFMHSHDIVYKWVHSVHHTTRNPTSFSIFAFSPLEAFLLGFYFILMCFFIPVNIYTVIIVFLINSFANIVGHLGYEFLELSFNQKIDKYIINSLHHNMHHKYGYMNYSIYFPFWDNLMNTFHPKYKEESEIFYKNKQK